MLLTKLGEAEGNTAGGRSGAPGKAAGMIGAGAIGATEATGATTGATAGIAAGMTLGIAATGGTTGSGAAGTPARWLTSGIGKAGFCATVEIIHSLSIC